MGPSGVARWHLSATHTPAPTSLPDSSTALSQAWPNSPALQLPSGGMSAAAGAAWPNNPKPINAPQIKLKLRTNSS
jgi:hypothetical protein